MGARQKNADLLHKNIQDFIQPGAHALSPKTQLDQRL